ncbi:MAG: hypothetical protein WBN97_00005, partial [Parvibaculum sp.]
MGDIPVFPTYAQLMGDSRPFIQVTLETSEAIEISDFIGAFASIGSQYDRFMRNEHPDLAPDAKIYVKQVRHGSIIAELLPVIMQTVQVVDSALIIDSFLRRISGVINAYKLPNVRIENIQKSELKDVMDGLAAIANDPNGRADIKSIMIEGGETNVRAAIQFNSSESRAIIENMREHLRMIEHHEDTPKVMVLMKFFQSNLKNADLEKRSGEQVIIPSVSEKPRPLVYASENAKSRIKHEIADSEGNIYKKGFYVDVMVDMDGSRIAAY